MGTIATVQPQSFRALVDSADELYKAGRLRDAVDTCKTAAAMVENVPADLCLKLARCYKKLGMASEAVRWTAAVVDAGDAFIDWQAAAGLLDSLDPEMQPAVKRVARLAILGSYTTAQFVPMLRLAARRMGIVLQTYEGHYGQYRQEILDPSSGLYRFQPELVLLAVHETDAALPFHSQQPKQDVQEEVRRWTGLWDTLAQHSSARVVQHTFAIPVETSWGHFGAQLKGSRQRLLQEVNALLGEHAHTSSNASIVDCDHLAAIFGKERWFSPRYWDLAKQGVALEALPLLSRHTAAVVAAQLGLTRKCLVTDLDNTLWGGVIGEDGLAGIHIGDGPQGEAFVRLQQYLLELKQRGILLAVCSKNNEADAKQPFEQHPSMRVRLNDFAAFYANWNSKPDNLREIAATLNIGLDSLVFLDDNPVERQAVRQSLPEVDVITLPANPSDYVRALSRYVLFETSSFTAEDAHRTDQYHARSEMARMASSAASLDDLHRSLSMQAVIEPFDDIHLNRIVQLIGKTNQFNLTTRRYSAGQVREFMQDPQCLTVSLQLRDSFTNHGLVSLAIAFVRGDVLEIDTWLMSCRVIGRRVEDELLSWLCRAAAAHHCTKLKGRYSPTSKNALVQDVYSRFGFAPCTSEDGSSEWIYDLSTKGVIVRSGFIEQVKCFIQE